MAITLDGTNGVTTPAESITGNSTVGGTLGVTGVTTLTGTLGVGTAPNATFGSHNYTQGTPAANKPIISAYSQGNSNNAGFALFNDTGNRGIWTGPGSSMRFTRTYEGNSTVDMNIDASGRVTKPTQPSFSARGQDASWRPVPAGIGWGTIAGTSYSNTTGNYQMGTNFTTTGHYGAEDIGNHFTEASGHFTAPVAGHYYFYIRMYLNRLNTSLPGIYLNPRINNLQTDGGGAGIQGSYHFERTTMTASNNAYIPFGRTDVYYMAANDTFTYALNAEGVGFQIYNQYTEFKGYLIG